MARRLAVFLLSLLPLLAWGQPVQVGSKRFTESYILGEIATQTLRASGVAAEHRQGLGNTAILAQALAQGEVAVYPEYTGTIARELLKLDHLPEPPELDRLLAARGLRIVARLGFNNSYALALREVDAERWELRTLSDLAALYDPKLRVGLSHEFLVRADGWPALARSYRLPQQPGAGLDHGLALKALAQGQIDLTDIYTTDAPIERLQLRVLRDDRGFFPRYDAVLLAHADLPEPARQALAELEGRLNERTMVALNARAEIDGQPFAAVARGYLAQASSAVPTQPPAPNRPGFLASLFAPDLPRLLGEHLMLVLGSVLLALLLGVPLAVWAEARPRAVGCLQAAVGLL